MSFREPKLRLSDRSWNGDPWLLVSPVRLGSDRGSFSSQMLITPNSNAHNPKLLLVSEMLLDSGLAVLNIGGYCYYIHCSCTTGIQSNIKCYGNFRFPTPSSYLASRLAQSALEGGCCCSYTQRMPHTHPKLISVVIKWSDLGGGRRLIVTWPDYSPGGKQGTRADSGPHHLVWWRFLSLRLSSWA